MNKDDYIPVTEAAELVGKSRKTIKNWIKKGALDYKRFPPNEEYGRLYVNKNDLPSYLRKK